VALLLERHLYSNSNLSRLALLKLLACLALKVSYKDRDLVREESHLNSVCKDNRDWAKNEISVNAKNVALACMEEIILMCTMPHILITLRRVKLIKNVLNVVPWVYMDVASRVKLASNSLRPSCSKVNLNLLSLVLLLFKCLVALFSNLAVTELIVAVAVK